MDETFTTKNYETDGGDRMVIGGTLEVLPGATIIGISGTVTQCAFQADSTATDIQGFVSDFNTLLAKLKVAGLMANE